MKKHIGIFKDDSEIREALRTKDLYSPYLAYVTDYNQVMYNPWNYIDVRIDWQLRDSISVNAEDYNQHNLQIICYKAFYWECTEVSEGITNFSYSSGDTGYSSSIKSSFNVAENTGEARALKIKFRFRDEENGPVVYEAVATINQAKSQRAVIGWYVDGQVTDSDVQMTYTGGTAQISIAGATSWTVFDGDNVELASGTTDQLVTVTVNENETYDTQWIYYRVEYTIPTGSGQKQLGVEQAGMPMPGFTTPNAWRYDVSPNFFISNSESAITIQFQYLESDNTWEIWDECEQTTLATGSGNTSYSIPVASNTGSTPVAAFTCNGEPFRERYIVRIYKQEEGENALIVEEQLRVTVLPSNPYLLWIDEPFETTCGVPFAGYVGYPQFLMYIPNGTDMVSEGYSSSSQYYTGNWYNETESCDIGYVLTLYADANMERESIPVTLDVELSDSSTYHFNLEQVQYEDPRVGLSNVHKTVDYTFVLYAQAQSYYMSMQNTMGGDRVSYSLDGANWVNSHSIYDNIPPNIDEYPITVVPHIEWKVVRDNQEIFHETFIIAQDTNSKPYIACEDAPGPDFGIDQAGGEYVIFQDNDNGRYAISSVVCDNSAFTVTLDDDIIYLSANENTSGEDLDGDITATFEDTYNNNEEVSYVLTVYQPSM